MIELKTGTRIWIAAGFTDLRRVLAQIVDHPISRIQELLPWNLAAPRNDLA